MAGAKPADGPHTPVPKNESTRGRNDRTANPSAKTKSQVIAPEGYAPVGSDADGRTPGRSGADGRSGATSQRAAGIPKATEESVSEFRNVTFVSPQQVHPEAAGSSDQTYTSRETAASTRVSAVTPAASRREQRALDKKRRAEAKRLLAERAAASKEPKPTPAPQAAERTLGQTPTQTPASVPHSRAEESAVEDFLPGVSSALAQAVAMPEAGVTSKPTPEFTQTPAGEKTVETDEAETSTALAPPTHNFRPNETEHVKFSYYDPFGKDNNRFVVVLHEQRFCYPYPGKFLSGYGPRGRSIHTGVDIKGVKNDTIRAAFAGTVRMSKAYSGYGNCVVIRHKNGLETLYGHNSRNLVRVGDAVRAGDPIALIGRTGRATTDHCHFEVRVQGQHINPALILDCQNHRLRTGVLSVTRQANGRIVAMNRASGLAPSQAMDIEDSATLSASAAGGGETRTAVSAPKKTAAGGGNGTSVYTVKSGDTLWGIARRFGTTVAKLCALNHLDREATLPLGKKLKLR